jgi:hypothetical protein
LQLTLQRDAVAAQVEGLQRQLEAEKAQSADDMRRVHDKHLKQKEKLAALRKETLARREDASQLIETQSRHIGELQTERDKLRADLLRYKCCDDLGSLFFLLFILFFLLLLLLLLFFLIWTAHATFV